MNRIFKTGILLLTVLMFVGCDRLTKTIARAEFLSSPPQQYLHGILRLEYTENPGSFMSLGADLPEEVRRLLYLGAAVIVLTGVVLLVMHIQKMGRMTLAGVTLLVGGACGNLLDRFINHGRVVDFIMIERAGLVSTPCGSLQGPGPHPPRR
jgi:signal peptidase II